MANLSDRVELRAGLRDLKADPAETRNLAGANPDKARELAAEWQKQTDAYTTLAKKDAPPPPKK